MPQWAGSSWYFLRYADPHNDKEFASMDKLRYWNPVDWYNGGMEHVTRHMIYSRFWHRFLYDIGCVPNEEPYAKRTAQGLILGPDGDKMSKTKGNVVDPNEVVDACGADVLRTYILFMGDYEKAAPWSEKGVNGCKRFLNRVWQLNDMLTDADEYSPELESKMNKAVKKVSEDYETLKYNTAIATLMALLNDIYDKGSVTRAELRTFLTLLNPVAPHITEEMWEMNGFGGMLAVSPWCTYDEDKIKDSTLSIPVQICGKLRSVISVDADADKQQVIDTAKADSKIASMLNGKTIVKEIYVPGKMVNFVIK